MRWADLDSLNHVNNVVYVAYAAEARELLGEGVAEATVRSVTVRYRRPLLLSSRSVVVVSSLEGAELRQEIRSEGADDVFADIATELGGLVPIVPHTPPGEALSIRVRRDDLDSSGLVSVTKMFELFQEARVLYLSTRLGRVTPGSFVVGTVSVQQARPLPWRAEAYDISMRLSRVGGGSLTIEAELSDGGGIIARSTSVLVGFDLESQRARRLDDDERATLEALVG
jgi:acyl-CoA thioester hydrolase